MIFPFVQMKVICIHEVEEKNYSVPCNSEKKLLNIFHGVESFHVFFSGATKEKIVVRNY